MFIEILRRLRFLWTLACFAAGAALLIYTPVHRAAAVAAPLLSFLPLYLPLHGGVRAGVTVFGVLFMMMLATKEIELLVAGAVLGAIIMVAGWLLSPLWRR